MNPFPYIEKWIVEHGSAASLRDHVALLKSLMEDLKAKKAEADVRASNAEARAEKAEARAEKAEAHSKKLQAELDDARQQAKTLASGGVGFVVGRTRRRESYDGLV